MKEIKDRELRYRPSCHCPHVLLRKGAQLWNSSKSATPAGHHLFRNRWLQELVLDAFTPQASKPRYRTGVKRLSVYLAEENREMILKRRKDTK